MSVSETEGLDMVANHHQAYASAEVARRNRNTQLNSEDMHVMNMRFHIQMPLRW